MREPLADIAGAALQRQGSTTRQARADRLTVLSGAPVVADVWVSGSLGFVLLLHRRNDGLLAEELYYSVRQHDGFWEHCDHLNGSILGVDLADPAVVEHALAGAPVSVIGASESLVHTGRGPDGDEGELVQVAELLVGSEVDLIEVERVAPASAGTAALSTHRVPGPLMLLALLPGERIRVSAVRTEGASRIYLGEVLDLHNPLM
ncbi:hypothetical protein [Streptomyces sp. NPDC046860]|uniref:hypothetical protein n=1 Tax=Streptomyces sp. NPDC046860 TaxID=3154495 RepID=UPI0033D0687D